MILALSAYSCVKEVRSNCPPTLPQDRDVVVAVTDKNYENAVETGDEVLDENLPLLSYVGSLVAWNHPRGTDRYDIHTETLASAERIHTLAPSYFADGINEVTVVGSETVYALQYGADSQEITLHPGEEEYNDIYVAGGEIVYPLARNYTMEMTRAKGKLKVDRSGMPDGMTAVEIAVDGVAETVGVDVLPAGDPISTEYARIYRGSTRVIKNFELSASSGDAPFEILLAPSSALSDTSTVTITFADDSGEQAIPPFEVVIYPNVITLVRPEYDPGTGRWQISVMVDDEWKRIENMDIV